MGATIRRGSSASTRSAWSLSRSSRLTSSATVVTWSRLRASSSERTRRPDDVERGERDRAGRRSLQAGTGRFQDPGGADELEGLQGGHARGRGVPWPATADQRLDGRDPDERQPWRRLSRARWRPRPRDRPSASSRSRAVAALGMSSASGGRCRTRQCGKDGARARNTLEFRPGLSCPSDGSRRLPKIQAMTMLIRYRPTIGTATSVCVEHVAARRDHCGRRRT